MIKFEQNITMLQYLIPAICSGVLFIGVMEYLYISVQTRNRQYISMLILGVFGLIFSSSELMILTAGGIMENAQLGMQFHRVEQISGAFMMFGLTLFLSQILVLNSGWQSINRVMADGFFGIASVILITAFIFPDFFISMTKHSETWLKIAADHGRGREGVLYRSRDVMLGILMIYSLVCFIIDMIWHTRLNLLPYLIGLILAFLGAIDDTVHVHTDSFIGIFSQHYFSRFTLGVTLFILISMSSLLKQYIDKARNVERAYADLDSAYRVINQSEQRFRQLAENINEIFILFDYINNVGLYMSPAYEKVTGRRIQEFYEKPLSWFDHVHPDDRNRLRDLFRPEKISDRFGVTFRFIKKDGSTLWLRGQVVAIRDNNKKIYRLACIVEDITDRKKSEEELSYIALHDQLTGLPNRRSLFSRFAEVISQARRESPKKSRALFFIDIDNFKDINDTLGHEFGDKLIIEVAQRLKGLLRESDYIFRSGGDEFTVILNGITEDVDAAIVARKIIDQMSFPIIIENKEMFVSVSIGISIYPKDGDEADTLIKYADMALNATGEETNIYRFYCNEMNIRAQEKISLDKNLRYAVAQEQLKLYYQPMVDIQGKIIGAEALLRWNHPELGMISPEKFIPLAESTGLIIDIGQWTLQTAVARVKKWVDDGFDLKISVNLSALQFRDDLLVEKISTVLEENRVDPKYLELEITESSIMDDPDMVVQKIHMLKDKGLSLSIDDFGIGYSSLSYLRRFKIDNLKVDRSFIKDLLVDDNNREITRAIIAMAHNLNLKVIAEGVENIEQMEFLRSLKCDIMQGFLFSKAIPADEFFNVIKKSIIVSL